MPIQIKKSARSARFQKEGREAPGLSLTNHPRAASIAKHTDGPLGLPWPIEMVALKRLKRAAHNARVHPKKQIKLIVESIQHYGYNNPILVDERRQVIGGHARIDAAERAGLQKIPAIVISGLTPIEKRALALADNAIAEQAGWDRSQLARELSDLTPLLAEAGLGIELTGFQPAQIDALMGDLIDPERHPLDDVPAIATPPVSRRGDLWLLHNKCFVVMPQVPATCAS